MLKEDTRFIPFMSQQEVTRVVGKLAAQVEKDLAQTVPLVVGVLKGAALFTADLVRGLSLELELDFIQVERYGRRGKPTEDVKLVHPLAQSVEGRDVLLVEDIVDRGTTLEYLRRYLLDRGACSVRVCTLLLREGSPARHRVDYFGAVVDRGFVVGYGMDYMEKFRNLNALYVIDEQDL